MGFWRDGHYYGTATTPAFLRLCAEERREAQRQFMTGEWFEMAAQEFQPPEAGPRLPEGQHVQALSQAEACPRCNQADLEPYANGSKWRCPACYYMAPCCQP